MGHFPCYASDFVRSSKTFGAFCTRVTLSRPSPTTHTTNTFTVPALEGSVTIPVADSTGFLAGDFVVVGTRVCLLEAPVHSLTGSGGLVFIGYMPGSLTAGNTVTPQGHRIINVLDPTQRTTDQTGSGWTVPNCQQSSNTVSITVQDRSKIPSGGIVMVTNYAGLFKVLSAPSSTSLSLQLIRAGDLLAGETCIQETSYTYLGTPVSQCYPLTYVEATPYRHFIPVDACAVAIASNSTATNTGAISIGYSAGNDTGRARMGDYAQGLAVQTGSVLQTGVVKPLLTNQAVTEVQRLAVPFGHHLLACVTTATTTGGGSTSCVVDLLVRGFFSEG